RSPGAPVGGDPPRSRAAGALRGALPDRPLALEKWPRPDVPGLRAGDRRPAGRPLTGAGRLFFRAVGGRPVHLVATARCRAGGRRTSCRTGPKDEPESGLVVRRARWRRWVW